MPLWRPSLSKIYRGGPESSSTLTTDQKCILILLLSLTKVLKNANKNWAQFNETNYFQKKLIKK
jgi:hypothetical protein